MVKSKLTKKPLKLTSNKANKSPTKRKEEDTKGQPKISSFFKKSSNPNSSQQLFTTINSNGTTLPVSNGTALPVVSKNTCSSFSHARKLSPKKNKKTSNNNLFKKKNNIQKIDKFLSPKKSESDSEVEIIETTPEYSNKYQSINIKLPIPSSPDLIPATPQNTTISKVNLSTKFNSLSKPNLDFNQSLLSKSKKLQSPKINNFLFNKSKTFKRGPEKGVGVSPNPKRNNDELSHQKVPIENCKLNILNKISSTESHHKENEQESFTILDGSSNELNESTNPSEASTSNGEVLSVNSPQNTIPLSVTETPESDSNFKVSKEITPKVADNCDVLNITSLENLVVSVSTIESSEIDHFKINKNLTTAIDEDAKENESKMNIDTVDNKVHSTSMDNTILDELLSCDFDKFSPFKEKPAQHLLPQNKKIEHVVKEGLGQYSYAVKGNYGRYIVSSVQKDIYQREISLYLISLIDSSPKFCSLSGFWYESVIKEGDIVHIQFAEEQNGNYRISDQKGMIIINPDLLISGTSIVSAVFCRRKAVLNERFKGYDSGNELMVIGSLVHQLFQEVVNMKKSICVSDITGLMKELIHQPQLMKQLYGLGLAQGKIEEEMAKFAPLILAWTENYIDKGGKCGVTQDQKKWNGTVTSIEDIEENIWSPRFGIKGKIDLTVATKVGKETKVVPLELKTGRSSFSAEHKGQVILYTMMMSDRRPDPESGLLLYLRDGAMIDVPAGEKEKRGLIQLRNDIVRYLVEVPLQTSNGDLPLPPLPEPLDNSRWCSKCDQFLTCATMHRAQSNTPPPPHEMASLVPMATEHLSQGYVDYFRQWCLLLNLEIGASSNDSVVRSLWCNDPSKRETSGTCLAKMIFEEEVEELAKGIFIHKMRRGDSQELKHLPHCFQIGENVLVSTETDLALSMGVVYGVASDAIQLVLDRNFTQYRPSGTLYHIDRYEYQNNMSTFFTNLALLLKPSDRSKELRELLIDGSPPAFGEGLDRDAVNKISPILSTLNKEQQRAVLRSLLAKDYSILEGFPGTGKTSTIVGLVRVLTTLGFSILLTSYTHSAVDNICLKLKEYPDVKFLRLGKVSRVHRDVLPYSEQLLTEDFSSVKQFETFYEDTLVVATTCLGMNHVIFRRKTFDFCIMDEASQVMEAASLGPLFFCSRFILVGDSLQLPPVIKSQSAKSLGMATSLFERLSSAHPSATVCLTLQYRMNLPIMALSNHLTYEGRLTCATQYLETASLETTEFFKLKDATIPLWLRNVASPALEDAVCFVDTRKGAQEKKDQSGQPTNPSEVQIILSLLTVFCDNGIPAGEIGVITPYRAQVKLLKEKILQWSISKGEVEVNTVDQYQGRDKCVIIYSCVRSGQRPEDVKTGEILNDWRRLNVAVTRAKRKLIIVGDFETLQLYTPFKKLSEAIPKDKFYSIQDGVDGFSWNNLGQVCDS